MSDVVRRGRPRGLGPAGRRLWAAVLGDYELTVSETELLRQACQTVDVIARCEAQLAAEDVMVPGSRNQPVVNPLLAQVASQRRLLESLIRSLSLPFPEEHDGRPRSPAGVSAALERWLRERGRGQVG